MRLYLYLGGAIAALLLVAGAFFYGVSTGEAREALAMQKKIDRIAAAADRAIGAAQVVDQAAAERSVQRETIIREIVREVPKIIDRAVYRNVCVDADGVQLVRRAVAAANGRLEAASRSASDPGGIQQSSGHR